MDLTLLNTGNSIGSLTVMAVNFINVFFSYEPNSSKLIVNLAFFCEVQHWFDLLVKLNRKLMQFWNQSMAINKLILVSYVRFSKLGPSKRISGYEKEAQITTGSSDK